ncbi:MAG: argininosuccinate synthase [Gemmatales bacterium]|nr:argininosuccinate synthase [Gemmatales bacterium]
MARVLFAFNGDLESRLALYWLAREQGHEVIALSVNLGQGIYLEPLGELALDLGAVSAKVVDLRESFLRDFCLPTLQADAVYQGGYFLGTALGRYAIAQEMVRLAHEEGCRIVAHSAAGNGNAQVRLESAIVYQDPNLEILAPVRHWPWRTYQEKVEYARKRRLPIPESQGSPLSVDRNLWGVSLYLDELLDAWQSPPPHIFQITRAPEEAPDKPLEITLTFERGEPTHLDGKPYPLLTLVETLNRLGGEHGVGRTDVVEDRLFGTKSREVYEAPAPTILLTAHRALESLVHSRELIRLRETTSREFAELVYDGKWFTDERQALQQLVSETQRFVTGDVRLKLYKGSVTVVGRRSPYSLYDPALASRTNQAILTSDVRDIANLWLIPARLAARQRRQFSAD